MNSFGRSCALCIFAVAVTIPSASYASVDSRASLSASQIFDLQRELVSALSAVEKHDFASPVSKQDLVVTTLEQVASRAVATDHSAGEVTSVVIAVSLSKGVSPIDVGRSLGRLAVSLSTCFAESESCKAARDVGATIANEGTLAMVDEFVHTVETMGGSVELAAVALQNPEVTAAIPGSVVGQPRFGNVAPLVPPPPACSNPSCN